MVGSSVQVKRIKKSKLLQIFYGEGRVPFTVGIKFGREGFFKINFYQESRNCYDI